MNLQFYTSRLNLPSKVQVLTSVFVYGMASHPVPKPSKIQLKSIKTIMKVVQSNIMLLIVISCHGTSQIITITQSYREYC